LRVESLEERCLLDSSYLQTNLVSDIPGLAANTDPNLHNPWGLVASPTGPFWVSDNSHDFAGLPHGLGASTLYNGAGQPLPLVVTIPPGSASPPGSIGSPTGIVFNGSSTDFIVSQGGNSGPALFIFATADGTISGWSPAVNFTNAIKVVDNSGVADYEGLALANNGSGNFLYAADFATGNIDVFNSQFQPTTLGGSFTDPNLPSGFTPYGIRSLDGSLYVTYIPNNFAPGGIVDLFDTNGNFLRRLVTGGNLNLPWGLAIAPHNFGKFSNALLVGNVADGHIDAYNPNTGAFRGQLQDTSGNPISIPGLWSLRFGNDGLAGSSDTLFFTAGINGYVDGLLGSIVPAKKTKPASSASLGADQTGAVLAALAAPLRTSSDASNQAGANAGAAEGLRTTGNRQTVSPLSTGEPQNPALTAKLVSSAVVRTTHRAAVDRAFADFDPGWIE
jgi:uncharacterized protein (TIGR03118 family)